MSIESNNSQSAGRNQEAKPRQSGGRKLYAIGLLPVLLSIIFYGLRRVEYALTFHPERYIAGQEWNLPEGGEDVFFTNRENLRLHGWFIQAESRPALATVIYFHGNGGNLSRVGWLGERLARRGFDVLLFDYRGYGRSEGEIIDEQNLYSDADAAYDYVVRERGVSTREVVLYGQSLGTTAVADLAERKQCGAIILESGPSSASALAETMLPWVPRWLHGLGKNRFESARKLASVSVPALVTHGESDRTIPVEHGRALFEAAIGPKKLLLFAGADHNVFGFGGDSYFDELSAFIRQWIARSDAAHDLTKQLPLK